MPSPYDTFVGDVAHAMVDEPATVATQPGAGAAAKPDAGTPDAGTVIAIDSPVFRPQVKPAPRFAWDKEFQALLNEKLRAEEKLRGGKPLTKLIYAVADVSGAGMGVMASNKERSPEPAFSIPKIGVMLALYQLQHDLRLVLAQTKGLLAPVPTDSLQPQFLKALKAAPEQVTQQVAADPPKLDELLMVDGLTRKLDISVGASGDLYHMIVESDDPAALNLIDALGMYWIKAVLERWGIAGLSDPPGGGMLVSHAYGDPVYNSHHNNRAYDFPAGGGDTRGINVASARGVVHCLVELARKNLVDQDSSEEMMAVYLGRAEPSNFGDFLADKYGKSGDRVRILRKVGFISPKACDCVYIEHEVQKKPIRYAAAAFGAADNPKGTTCDSAVLTKFIEIVDAAILERNGIKADPSPPK